MADMKEFDGNHSKRLDSPTTSSQTHDENEEKNAAATGRPSSDVLVNEQGQEGDSQDESEYLPPWKMALVTFALCLAIFCMALDNTIVATAIPRITEQFKSLDDVGWYGSAYLLTSCSMYLIFGKLYTLFPIKPTYLAALAVFELGSLICAVTPNSLGLILGRAVAGLGVAALFSGSIIIISRSVPLRQRPIYTGFITGVAGVSSVAGPLLGGAFTDHLSWRWCFYINLPLGGFTALVVLLIIKPAKAVKQVEGFKEKLEQLDILGNLLYLPGIICLLLALEWGGNKYPWNNARIIALFVLCGVLLSSFLLVQYWLQDKATVPPRVAKNRSVWGSVWFGLCLGASMFVLIYYLPVWFQVVKGASATKSGVMNLPMILSVTVFSVVTGGLVSVLGYYGPFMILSTVCMSVGAGLMANFETSTGSAKWIGYQILYGVGLGFGFQQALTAVQTCSAPADVPIATALVTFAQNFGGALFLIVAQSVFKSSLKKKLQSMVPHLDPDTVVNIGVTNLRKELSSRDLLPVLGAYNDAVTLAFYVSAATSAATIFGAIAVRWKSVRTQKQ